MVAIVEQSWQDVIDGKPFPESLTRKFFREAVEETALKAREALTESHGRIDAAVKIVLAGDVELLDEGKAKVASQSSGTTKYFLVNGECECRDFEKAPANFCKHRLAYGIFKRASTLAKQRLEAQLDSTRPVPTPEVVPTPEAMPEAVPVPVIPQPQVEAQPQEPPQPMPLIPQPEGEAEPQPVPVIPQSNLWSVTEAPASCCLKFTLNGVEVLYTMRDTNDDLLYRRVKRILPIIQERMSTASNGEQSQANQDPCPIHNVPMKRYTKGNQSWLSHQLADGTWCRGK